MLVGITSELVGLGLAVAPSQIEQPRSRHVALPRGTRIPSILLPDDDFVIVERDRRGTQITVVAGASTRDQDLDQRARDADVIVGAELVRSESMLVDDETWIETNATLVARQVIKDTEPTSLQLDASITFNHSGGEMLIGRRHVRADYFYRFTTGERYLVFLLKRGRDRNIVVGLMGFPFRITSDERLAPMLMSTGKPMTVPSPLYDLGLKTVIGELIWRMRPQ
jgi:hypothetical protein